MKTTLPKIGSLVEQQVVRLRFIVIIVSLAFCGFYKVTKAVSPAPDGGYPRGNTANGAFALLHSGDGKSNTAVGFGALENNNGAAPYASANTAIGAGALSNNTDGFANNAVGRGALASNTAGSANQAIGFGALFHNDYGRQNVAIGDSSMANNVSGFYNTVIGDRAGPFLVAGNGNVYLFIQ